MRFDSAPNCLHSGPGRGKRVCFHRPAAAVGGGPSGGGRRPGLPREHHYPMCQGQPLFWPVGEKSSRRSATSQTRYSVWRIQSIQYDTAHAKLLFSCSTPNYELLYIYIGVQSHPNCLVVLYVYKIILGRWCPHISAGEIKLSTA